MEEAEEGGSNGVRKWSKGEHGRKGDREGGKLQGRYPEEDTGQYTVYSAQHKTRPLPLRLWYYRNTKL